MSTQQPANFAGRVVMIDVQTLLFRWLSAQGAKPMLSLKYYLILGLSEIVVTF